MTGPAERPFGGPGYSVVEAVLKTTERFGMLGEGHKVVVAVSGGPDSTCLLDVLWRLASRVDLSLEVAHIDHGTSEASEKTAARVSHAAAAAGFDVHVVKATDLEGPNFHARAREFRYGFLDIVADRTGADATATGHTLDDRVETTLARLVHGGATEALAGIPPAEGRRIRPLIELRRSEARAYCDELGLTYEVDPANDDPRFERGRIRRSVLTAIEEGWGDGAIRAMAGSAEHLRRDAEALAEMSERLGADLVDESPEGRSIPRGPFELLPRGIRRRILESAVGRVRDRSGGIEAALDALDAGGRSGARFAVAGGAEIVIKKDAVVVRSGSETDG